MNRGDPDLLPPFNIEWENSARKSFDKDRFLAIGGYGFDGSTTCIERRSGRVTLFVPSTDRPAMSWPDLESWLRGEIARLSALFDSRGKRLVDESATVPKPSLGNAGTA